MESLEGVDRLMMSGSRATLLMKKDAKLTEAAVKKALESKKLTFEGLSEHKVPRAHAAYVAKTPKFT